jgi:serine/threonine-protein kinase
VIDAGEDDGMPYIVFEYVDGETLKARIRRLGRLEVAEAVAYAIELARALGAAHERSIVHRDVKPQNVMIDSEGAAKITDFGIARMLTEEGLTADGRVLGTTDYVSPEQALGHNVTGQSDLYSLGVVLYEMLTGEVPFEAPSPVAVAMKHVREELPDVQARRPEMSAALATVVDRATAKSLTRRYRDAKAMIADLEEALAIETVRAGHAGREATLVLQTVPGRVRRRLPMQIRQPVRFGLTGVAMIALLAGIAVFVITRTHRGTGVPANAKAPAAQSAVSLGQTAAQSYNPFGSGGAEDASGVGLAIDGDPNTSWSSEHYIGGQLHKPGTGLVVDAAPGVAARSVQIQTPTPGFDVQIYAAQTFNDTYPQGDLTHTLADRGWIDLADQSNITNGQRISLDTAGRSFRYYLLWITRLPASNDHVEIAEFTLFK